MSNVDHFRLGPVARIAPGSAGGSSPHALDQPVPGPALFGEFFRGRLSRRQLLVHSAQLGLAALAVAALLGEAAPQAAAQTAMPGGKLTFGVRSDFTNLDPHVTSAVSDGILMMAVFDRLIEHSQDGTLYPGLAME
jgi:hypothetical protein